VEGEVLFLQRSTGDGEQCSGFTDDQLAHLAQTADMFHTCLVELYPPSQGVGYRYALSPGKYAFFPVAEGEFPDRDLMTRNELCFRDAAACRSLTPLPMSVLEVTP
jgi:hypothetical protein